MFVIEANPNPSLAAEDDFAQSANADGMTYDALIQEILNAALSLRSQEPYLAADQRR